MIEYCRQSMSRLWLAVSLIAACSKPSPDCERATRHVLDLVTSGPPDSKPSAEEQGVIDQIHKAALERCTDEGLSAAQRDCILAAPSLMDRAFLTCPALVAKPPTWIKAPIGHPEVIDELDKLRGSATGPSPSSP